MLLPRALLWILVGSPLLPACSLGSFDYLSEDFGELPLTGQDAGTKPRASALPTDCGGLVEGSDCDDLDACTTESQCSGGMCVSTESISRAADAGRCVIADSFGDFTPTQGFGGFWYGFWNAGEDLDGEYEPAADFQEMSFCSEGQWKATCASEDDSGFRWTLILPALQHADTQPFLQVPVRRWVSHVSGPVSVSLDHHHADPGGGDGTLAELRLDGKQVWQNQISGSDAIGAEQEVALDLKVGSTLEQLLYPVGTHDQDMTWFTMTIRGR